MNTQEKYNKLKDSISREYRDLPYIDVLIEILCTKNQLNKKGFPILEDGTYQKFLANIPHLFRDGQVLLEIFDDIGFELNKDENSFENELRAIKVLTRVTLSAAITAPSDLWTLRQIFSTYHQLKLHHKFLNGSTLNIDDLVKEFDFDKEYFLMDLNFLHSRGYVHLNDQKVTIASSENISDCFGGLTQLDDFTPRNLVPLLVRYFVDTDELDAETKAMVENFFIFKKSLATSSNWIAGRNDIELGFRLVPFVLAIRFLEIHTQFKEGTELGSIAIKLNRDMRSMLQDCGVFKKGTTLISNLGERIFNRGPGPIGIIHAYHAYMTHHLDILKGKKEEIWVARGENVAASQDANAKSFKLINESLDKFCEKNNFRFTNFIEHAVGQGEATRQRYNLSGDQHIKYFGADLEDSAIDKAIENQNKKFLPANMKFIRGADIGQPSLLIQGVVDNGGNCDGAIMVVGNGFHEVRNQDNDKMIAVFKEYCDAGIILLFTEESGLTNDDLINTGWNTYHAGFRYMHELSGQGLRPAIDNEDAPGARYSWKKCAALAGYNVMEEFTTRTRTVYPSARKNGYNPAISVNYFCVPEKFVAES